MKSWLATIFIALMYGVSLYLGFGLGGFVFEGAFDSKPIVGWVGFVAILIYRWTQE